MFIRLLKAAAAVSILLSLAAAILFVILSWQQNVGKSNTIIIRNESDHTLTDVAVWIARERRTLDDIAANMVGHFESTAGPEGITRVAFRIGEDRYSCAGGYITHGISSHTEVRIDRKLRLGRRFYYPENRKDLTYSPCTDAPPATVSAPAD